MICARQSVKNWGDRYIRPRHPVLRPLRLDRHRRSLQIRVIFRSTGVAVAVAGVPAYRRDLRLLGCGSLAQWLAPSILSDFRIRRRCLGRRLRLRARLGLAALEAASISALAFSKVFFI